MNKKQEIKNKKFYLYINTTLENKLEIALYKKHGQKILSKTQAVKRDESEKLLKTVDKLLSNGAQPVKVKGIIAIKGPRGRFSAIRTGVVCANVLGFAWDVPVLGIEQGEDVKGAIAKIVKFKGFYKPVKPIYEKEPNLGK